MAACSSAVIARLSLNTGLGHCRRGMTDFSSHSIHQTFKIMDDHGYQQVNQGLSSDIVDQRMLRETIDERQQVGDQNRFSENDGRNRHRNRSHWRNPICLQHQRMNECHDMQGDEKKMVGGSSARNSSLSLVGSVADFISEPTFSFSLVKSRAAC